MNALASFSPILIVSIGSLSYLLGGKAIERLRAGAFVAIVLIAAAAWASVRLHDSSGAIHFGVVVNTFSRLLACVACIGALISILATSASLKSEEISMVSEYYYLMLTSLCGALIMIFASDYLTLFIGVEVASLALYCLCGARIAKSASSEASMKYFLLGCFSSAFLLYGIAMWYGVTGTLAIAEPSSATLASPMIALSFLMILIGLAFKIGLAPFHLWVPDVYQGSPTSVTTFMSCVVKVAALAALVKISAVSFGFSATWSVGPMWVISVLAMTLGNLAALQQRSVKRMLAYSSIAQAGYMMMGLVIAGEGGDSIAATLYYLIAYCGMTIGAFAVLSVVGPDADSVDDIKGLGKRSPFLAICMTLFFLALAGLPPSLGGLMGKVYLFSNTLSAKFYGLAIIAAINSAIACAYYFRVPVAMFFQSSENETSISVSSGAYIAITACAVAVIMVGIMPEELLATTRAAAVALLAR